VAPVHEMGRCNKHDGARPSGVAFHWQLLSEMVMYKKESLPFERCCRTNKMISNMLEITVKKNMLEIVLDQISIPCCDIAKKLAIASIVCMLFVSFHP
jgi:hypothetical protein